MLMRKFIFFLTLLGTAFGLSAAEAPDAVRVTPVIEFIDFVKYGSVNEIAGTPVSMRVTHDAIVIENAGEGSMLSIYTLDGRCVVNTTIPDSYSVERSLLAKGAYIIKINKTTFKILL